MIWQSATDFWAMGGYAVYVWGSVGVSAVMLVLEVMLTRRGHRHALDAVSDAIQIRTEEALAGAARRSSGSAS